jgi:large-conductance mechanosensitive channel
MKQFTFIIAAILLCFSVQAQEKTNSRKARKEEKRKKIDALIKQEEEGVMGMGDLLKKAFQNR